MYIKTRVHALPPASVSSQLVLHFVMNLQMLVRWLKESELGLVGYRARSASVTDRNGNGVIHATNIVVIIAVVVVDAHSHRA